MAVLARRRACREETVARPGLNAAVDVGSQECRLANAPCFSSASRMYLMLYMRCSAVEAAVAISAVTVGRPRGMARPALPHGWRRRGQWRSERAAKAWRTRSGRESQHHSDPLWRTLVGDTVPSPMKAEVPDPPCEITKSSSIFSKCVSPPAAMR